ncbi:MAG: DinB family protein [Dehalococcoidia bacterium]
MGQQAEALAARVEQVVTDVAAAAEGCSDAAWRATTSAEGWSVGTTVHHVAGHLAAIGFIQGIVAGQPAPPLTMEMINAGNAQHAAEYPNPDRAETLALLRSAGASAAAAIRGLSDEQLSTMVAAPVAGQAPIAGLIEMILVHSSNEHLQSIKATTLATA